MQRQFITAVVRREDGVWTLEIPGHTASDAPGYAVSPLEGGDIRANVSRVIGLPEDAFDLLLAA